MILKENFSKITNRIEKKKKKTFYMCVRETSLL